MSLILVICAGALHAEEKTPPLDREMTLVVSVPPVPQVPRASDEMIARVHVDFAKYLANQPVDLSSLVVVAITPEGTPLDFPGNAYARTRGERPLRFYDDAIEWEYEDHEGYAHDNNGAGTPLRKMPGGLRFFNAIGEGRAGQIAWAHTQRGDAPATYAIGFNALKSGVMQQPAPAGFIGDGVNRCLDTSSTFSPVFQGRVCVADLNGDGLFDLVMGNATGTVLFYPNVGKAEAPRFGPARILCTDDGKAIDIGWSSAPAPIDWDHDGRIDLIVGAEKECFIYFRNVGDRHAPRFHHEGLVRADGAPLRTPHAPTEEDPGNKIYLVDYYPVPETVDWDGDGDIDLLAGGYITGRIWYYENVAGADRPPEFRFRGALQADGKDLDVTWCASPGAGDLDGDGDLDLVSGAMQMTAGGGDKSDPNLFLWYFENIGTRKEPKLSRRPFPAKNKTGYGALGTPRVVDFNNDRLPDLIVSVNGDLLMYANVGSANKPEFDLSTKPLQTAWGNGQLGFNQLVDFNGDGWPDMFSSLSQIVLNTGRGAPGLFERRIPLKGAERILHPSPGGDHWDYRTLADLDNDGLLDILLGDHQGHVWFHRNIGKADAPSMETAGVQLALMDGKPIQVGLAPDKAWAFDVLQGARTAVTAGDFNHDGKTDVAVSDTYGFLRVFLRADGDKLAFTLGAEVSRLQPTRMTAQRADWNGDGWDDLVASYANGYIYVLINRGEKGKSAFQEPRLLDVPPCYGDPWPYVGDWNHDGDDDLIIDQYGYTRFVERSFLEYGYRPARIDRFEKREKE